MWGKSVQHDEIYLLSKFGENLLTYVGVNALFGRFLLFLMLLFLKIFSETTLQNSVKAGIFVLKGILYKMTIWIFDLL